MNLLWGRLTGVAILLFLCVGCGDGFSASASSTAAAPIVERDPEPWISAPRQQWPQITLTNDALFQGHTPLEGASSFLIQATDDRVVAATAGHLIGPNGGVEPRLPIHQLNQKLISWVMHPRTRSDDVVTIKSVGAQGLEGENLDWLILSIEESESLPAYPLKPRREPVRIGETVYLIGCPYVERDCQQNVYRGVVTARGHGDRFRYDISPAVDIRGFSGAPIIDEKGYVVGVMTVWFEPKMSGEKFLEAGGEDIAPVYDALLQEI